MASRRQRLAGIAGKRALSAIRGGDAAISISVLPPSTLEAIRKVAAISDEVDTNITRIIDDEVADTTQTIKSAWPVDTGFSKSEWTWFRESTSLTKVRWVIQNLASYAGYVHYKGDPTPLLNSLVIPEIQRAQVRISGRLQELFAQIRQRFGVATAPQIGPSGAGGTFSRIRRFFGF